VAANLDLRVGGALGLSSSRFWCLANDGVARAALLVWNNVLLVFIFLFLFFFRLCASLMSKFILDIMLLQRLDVYDIILN
jgi:hypothetical protein